MNVTIVAHTSPIGASRRMPPVVRGSAQQRRADAGASLFIRLHMTLGRHAAQDRPLGRYRFSPAGFGARFSGKDRPCLEPKEQQLPPDRLAAAY